MPLLFLDENVKIGLADVLRAAGIETRTVRDEGQLHTVDAALLLACANQGWMLVTQNRRDFRALHEGWVTWTTDGSKHSPVLGRHESDEYES